MNTVPGIHPIRHLSRYHDIAHVLLSHGFGFVFNHLSPEWRPWKHGFGPGPDGSAPPQDLAAHFRQALEELGPTFVKLGQVLSTRPDLLPPAYIGELSKLRDSVPPLPWEEICQVLSEEYGRAPDEVFASIDPQPLGAASLAQVHAATLKTGEEVVVKVQRPNITATISEDLDILTALAKASQSTALGDLYDFVGIVEEFSFTLKSELDYRQEGRNADRFRENFAHERYLYIPHIYWEYSRQHVLVQERLQGIKLDDVAGLTAAGYDCHRVALHCARMIVKEILEDCFFHADPHPGNLVVMPGEVIGAMDFGMVGHLAEGERRILVQLYSAIAGRDAAGIVDQLIRMGAVSPDIDRVALAHELNRLLNKYYGLPLKAIQAREVMEDIMPLAYRYRLRLPGDLWLLIKTIVVMWGVGLQLDPGFDIFTVFEPMAQRLVWELILPRQEWSQILLNRETDWADLLETLPRAGTRLLESAERGDLFQVRLKDWDLIMCRLDRQTTRLALSILVSALILGVAMLMRADTSGGLMQLLMGGGFLMALGLGVWLMISILRGTH